MIGNAFGAWPLIFVAGIAFAALAVRFSRLAGVATRLRDEVPRQLYEQGLEGKAVIEARRSGSPCDASIGGGLAVPALGARQ